MKTVWKYPIEITDEQIVPALFGASPIYVGLDPKGFPCIWCDVEDTKPGNESLRISIRGTGHPSPENVTYLGSFIQGPFVWHVYYRI